MSWKMEEDFYCLLSNTKSADIFEDNSAHHFRVALPQYLQFTRGIYECALMDFSCTTQNFPDKVPMREIYICVNITSEPITGGDHECNLLRYTTVKRARFQMETFSVPYYIRVKPMRTNILELYI